MKISLRLSVTFLLVALYANSHAQNPPVFSQFFVNQYQFNPSYVANNGFTEANLFYRRQWLGIDNAPTSAGINFQAPIGRNVSLGLLGYSDKSALLSNTSVLGTFGYRIRFGYLHHLNFGISGGMGFNNFDLSAIEDTNDPALAGIAESNTYLNGQVGFNYRWKNLNIGFALPKLFDSKPNSTASFNEVEFDKLEYRFGSASYSIPIGNVTITPSVVYRSIDAYQDQLEGMLIASFKNIFWIGASYREEYGVTGFIGINVKGLLRIGYAYEKATGDIADVVDGTHEVYLGARLSKHNREDQFANVQQQRDSLRQTAIAQAEPPAAKEESVTEEKESAEKEKVEAAEPEKETQPVNRERLAGPVRTETAVEPPKDVAVEKPVEEKPERVVQTQTAPANNIPDNRPAGVPRTETKNTQQFNKQPDPGFYVVVGVYKVPENALQVMSNLRSKGMKPSLLYNANKDYYYVYTFKSLDKTEAIRQLQVVKRQNQFFAAWVFSVIE